MEWLAPQTLQETADNVEAAHEDHDEGGCACVHRMRAALTGQPDPDGVGYVWPVLHYGCVEAPKYGCVTVFEAVTESIMADMYKAYAAREFLGLSAALR